MRVLECDINLPAYPVGTGAVANIIKCCPQLEELIIDSKVFMRAMELQSMFEEMDDSKIQKFQYNIEKDIGDIRVMCYEENSDSEFDTLDSKSYNISVEKDKNSSVVMILVTKKLY